MPNIIHFIIQMTSIITHIYNLHNKILIPDNLSKDFDIN